MQTLLINSNLLIFYVHVHQKQIVNKYNFAANLCGNQISRTQNIGYCIKESTLSSRVQKSSITYSPVTQVFHSLYTTKTQDLVINITYQMQNLPSFAIFGLTYNILLMNSNVSVTIPQDIAQGSLICFSCDVMATQTDFAFICSGQNISGLVLDPNNILKLEKSLIQCRLNGINVGGLVLSVTKITMLLSECNMSSYIIHINIAGSVIALVLEEVSLEVKNVRICSNVKYFGQGSLPQTFMETCIVCREATYAYGLCYMSLQYGEVIADKLVCKYLFIFDGDRCSCSEGLIVNESSCINLLNSVNTLINDETLLLLQISDLTDQTNIYENQFETMKLQQDQMKTEVTSLYQFNNLQQNNIVENIIKLQKYIISNFSNTDSKLLKNVNVLDERIFNNMTIINDNISTLNTHSISLNNNITQLKQQVNKPFPKVYSKVCPF
ncbi:Hypothetical_protein [Hexamita inflata]|uniref:Hypothetical_protein n=1 Tax=Hexamita inflata TaxID=28002 RepID=A0AA86TY97_9EUKA|nr:Hypothetical protein HINF_LOCUS12768 [Hexamita inflata]